MLLCPVIQINRLSPLASSNRTGETHRKEPFLAIQERDARAYELVTVFIPEISEEDTQAQVERVTTYISSAGGDVSRTLTGSPWGRRRLAYTIRYNGTDYRDGYYTVFHFDSRPSNLSELERDLKLDINVMRYLLVHNDPKAGEKQTDGEGEAVEGEEAADIASTEQTEASAPAEAGVAETTAVQDSPESAADAVAPNTTADAEQPESAAEPAAAVSPEPAGASGPVEVAEQLQEGTDPTDIVAEPIEGSGDGETPETAASETGDDTSDKE
jgi:small subunit ribosomal protein S6